MWPFNTRKPKAVEASAPMQANRLTGNDTLTIDLQRLYFSAYRKEIADWQAARIARHAVQNPSTYQLQRIYTDAMIDCHLTTNVENRTLRILNKAMLIRNSDETPNPELTKLITASWFREVLAAAMDSIFFGYSLIYIKSVEQGRIKEVQLVDREHVLPEQGLLVSSPTDISGINIADYPTALVLVRIGRNNIGLLEKASALTILKRHSWASWDEFEQLFGVPIRIGRTADASPAHMAEMDRMLQAMGSAAYAVLPKSVDIEIKENSRSDASNVFERKIALVNSEISKLINGQTMTMDQGSSRSQGEVHENTQAEITKADIAAIESWFNDHFIHTLSLLGYPLTPGEHKLDITDKQVLSLQDRIQIDSALLTAGYRLSPDYITRTYDVELDTSAPAPDPDNTDTSLSYPFF